MKKNWFILFFVVLLPTLSIAGDRGGNNGGGRALYRDVINNAQEYYPGLCKDLKGQLDEFCKLPLEKFSPSEEIQHQCCENRFLDEAMEAIFL